MNRRFGLLGAPLVVLALGACSDNTAGHLSLAVSSVRSAAAAASAGVFGGGASPTIVAAGDSTLIILGSDSIILRSVELVVREVELKRVETATCDDVVDNDDCEEFETGATLVAVPLGATAVDAVVTVDAPAGQYDELEFKIHKPEAPEDASFISANPSFDGVSIRVSGTFSQAGNRSDFVFLSDMNTDQETLLSPPLTVSDGEATNVTLRVDLANWFVNAAKTALVDPASANKGQPNENLVRDNIEASFEAFRDDNHDGHDDDGIDH